MNLKPSFMRHVEYDPFGGCWLWNGFLTSGGYGVYSSSRAHRVAYESLVGPIPSGLMLDHVCRVRCCCNPSHLRPVTPRVNVLENSVAVTAINAKVTHCPQGHPYDEINTRHRRGRRYCFLCQQVFSLRYKRRVRQARRDTALANKEAPND